MRLVLITPGYTPTVQKRGEELCKYGIEVRQITCLQQYRQYSPPPAASPGVTGYRLVPIPIYRPGNPHRGMLLSLMPWIRSYKPHVIAIERDPDTLMALQAAILRNLWATQAKLILHSWQNVARKLSKEVRFVLNRVLRAADCICCANTEALEVLKRWGYTGKSVHQPWKGVDTSVFYPRAGHKMRHILGLEGRFIVGYVGRIVTEKGLEDLVLAIQPLPSDVHCVIIGHGGEQPRLEQLIKTLNLEHRIHFLGPIPNTQLPDYFSMMDVLVLPSHSTRVWKEQFGLVLIEAMACETPAIGSDSGAIAEVIGSAGLVFPEGDCEALAEQIHMLYRLPGLRNELGQKALKRVHDCYSLTRISRGRAQVYKDVAIDS